MKSAPTHVNEDSFCDGCGMDPIIGNMYSCSKCANYNLCEGCYQSVRFFFAGTLDRLGWLLCLVVAVAETCDMQGVHGFEDSTLLKLLREDYALRSVMDACKNKVPETVFTLLMTKVCRGQVDRFNFLVRVARSVHLGVVL